MIVSYRAVWVEIPQGGGSMQAGRKQKGDDPGVPSSNQATKMVAGETVGQRLAGLLERTRPYRELIGIAVAGIAALSGAVAWAVAHFATQAELFYLELPRNRFHFKRRHTRRR
jgi:hypothetical protein